MTTIRAATTPCLSKLLLGSCALFLLACGGPAGKRRSYPTPEVSGLLSELQSRQGLAHSFVAESRMEYWVDDQRIKPTVLVMGQRGARVRFNALSPAGDDVAADLACNGDDFQFVDFDHNCQLTGPCNGADFQFVDFDHNCQLTGPCNKDSIGKLLRVSLEPDDFLLLAIGQAPLIPDPTGTVRWDAKARQEVLELQSADGNWKQRIVLDGREQRWDVLSSTVWNAEGKIEWRLTNKEFSVQKSEDGKTFRVPAKTRFEQPEAKAEVTIRWTERSINDELSEDKFVMEIPALPRCGS